MINDKLSAEKIILVMVILIALGLAGYFVLSQKTPAISVVMQPTEEPTPTSTPESLIVSTSVPSPNPENDEVDLGTYNTKELLGENKDYSVYLLDSIDVHPTKTGKIVVYDKNKKVAISISGLFEIFGATIVSDDGEGKYIALSTGTSTSRSVIVLSLFEKRQIIDEFCSSHLALFWKEYIIYASCDSSIMRSWGDGEASGIEIINLVNGQVEVLFKADLLHDFSINKIEENILFYNESSIEKESDWNVDNAWKSEVKTYKLVQ